MVQRQGAQAQIMRIALELGSPVASSLAAHTLGGSSGLPTHQQVAILALPTSAIRPCYGQTYVLRSSEGREQYSRWGR